MVLPLKASDTAGIGPLTLFYAVRTFVQAKNIIFLQKSNTNPDFFRKFFAKTQICHECVCFQITPARKNHRPFSDNPKSGGGLYGMNRKMLKNNSLRNYSWKNYLWLSLSW